MGNDEPGPGLFADGGGGGTLILGRSIESFLYRERERAF